MASEWYPFILTDSVTVSANGTGTLELSIGATEEFEGASIHFLSTGSFQITSIKDSGGKPYTDADSTNVIDSTLFTTSRSQNKGVQDFYAKLQLVPNTTLFIDVKDTSGSSNTIRCYIIGKKRSI